MARIAEVTPVEGGTLWQLVDTASIPRRPAVPVALPVNYLQGVSLRQSVDGGWWLDGNAGACCFVPLPWGSGYEGLAALRFGVGWQWTLAPNEWGQQGTLDEHENAFPAALGGRLAYTKTEWSKHAAAIPDRVGVGLLLGSWATGWTRAGMWLPADGTAHWALNLMESPTGTWLYTQDTTASTSQIVRRQVRTNGTLGPPRATSWDGVPPTWHPVISDIVRGADGAWYALEQVPEGSLDIWAWRELAEWRSVAETQPVSTDVGVVWKRTGRRIRPELRSWWDGGYARAENGDRASGLVAGLCGDGRGAETGAWEVCVWQPDGVAIPAAMAPHLRAVTAPAPPPGPTPTPSPSPTPEPVPGVLTWDVREDQEHGVQVHVWVFPSSDPTHSPAVVRFADGRVVACASGGPACRVVGVTPGTWTEGAYSTRLTITDAAWAQVSVTGPSLGVIAPREVVP